MNQEQAQKVAELYDTCPEAIYPPIARNIEHVKAFAISGEYQHLDDVSETWETGNNFNFLHQHKTYRPVPERRINWEKAMKNGAYGLEVNVRNSSAAPLTQHKLRGVRRSHEAFEFLTDKSNCLFDYCEPLPGFEVPDSWLEDV
jgi:hypothetical protein